MEDEYQNTHGNDDHHSGWSPEDDTCPIMGTILIDEQGQRLPF